MKKLRYYRNQFITIYSIIIIVTACGPMPTSPTSTNSPTAIPTQFEKTISTITPMPTPYNSAPEDPTLDQYCRETINFFFSFRNGFDVQAYRNLFTQSAQHLADAVAINPPLEARTILVLMPVSLWWQKNNPATPMPGMFLPEAPGEYIYYVEYTGHYGSNETPVVTYPDAITITLVQEGPSKACKIKNYGKG